MVTFDEFYIHTNRAQINKAQAQVQWLKFDQMVCAAGLGDSPQSKDLYLRNKETTNIVLLASI